MCLRCLLCRFWGLWRGRIRCIRIRGRWCCRRRVILTTLKARRLEELEVCYFHSSPENSISDLFIGPHIGPEHAWPMSLLLQVMTSDDDKEIGECIDLVLQASRLGLVHESINVNRIHDYTRSWFACKLSDLVNGLVVLI
jgi:hypothetical protein